MIQHMPLEILWLKLNNRTIPNGVLEDLVWRAPPVHRWVAEAEGAFGPMDDQ